MRPLGKDLASLELAASWEPRARSQDLQVGRPPASSPPSCTGPLEGAGGARRAGGGSGRSQASRDFQVHPQGPGPVSFLGRRALSPVPHEVSALGRSPLQFSGGRSWPPVPPTKQAQPLGASPPCFPSSVWVTPLPGLPAGQETGGAGWGACSPQLRATN